jgi:menaquinone-dependent protoporphyrinogen oxidase|tara:strand:- start:2477 stop:2995 length:519 start_codon:yes stop_codon:yes gene_type:complete
MHNALIIYSSTDGHTETICKRISNFLNNKNETKIISLDEATKIDLTVFNKIIIGASIRYGKHSKKLYKFIESNKSILDQKQSTFFSVNVVARKPEKNTPETNPYIKKFLKISNWKPKKIGVFAGRVDYPNYGFFDKYIIKFIMFLTNGPTDTSQSYEFTDWPKVDEFARELT